MKKNDEIKLVIEGVTAEGNGVGRCGGVAVFVPGSAVGDELEVRIVKVLKNYCFGKIMKIIAPSPDRIEPDCAVFSRCGGCAFRHISYEAEKQIKWQRVADCIKRIGGIDAPIKPIIAAKETLHYRNKAQFPVGAGEPLQIGFYALHSHRIIPCRDCALQPVEFLPILNKIAEFCERERISVYDEEKKRGLLRHIYLRRAAESGEIMVCLVICGKKIPNEAGFVSELLKVDSNIKSILINENYDKNNVILGKRCRVLFGQGYINDTLCGVQIRINALSFYQVNRDMAQRLYQRAKDYAQPQGKTVLDLYCGAGTIGLSMASGAKKIIGVEIVPEAVEDAKINAEINGISNAEFICAPAQEAAVRLSEQGVLADLVVLDPPRKGASADLIKTIAEDFAPERVVYVSCDPATLARDLKIFGEFGYKTIEVTPVDLFPRTAHVETVVLMIKTER
jgi:23S rRNA (uracil1939-C5)-methyltransferase